MFRKRPGDNDHLRLAGIKPPRLGDVIGVIGRFFLPQLGHYLKSILLPAEPSMKGQFTSPVDLMILVAWHGLIGRS